MIVRVVFSTPPLRLNTVTLIAILASLPISLKPYRPAFFLSDKIFAVIVLHGGKLPITVQRSY